MQSKTLMHITVKIMEITEVHTFVLIMKNITEENLTKYK